jgi:hypothetical protein
VPRALRLGLLRNCTALSDEQRLAFFAGLPECLLLPSPARKLLPCLQWSYPTASGLFSPFLAFLQFCISLISPAGDPATVTRTVAITSLLVRSITVRVSMEQPTAREVCRDVRLLPFLAKGALLTSIE